MPPILPALALKTTGPMLVDALMLTTVLVANVWMISQVVYVALYLRRYLKLFHRLRKQALSR